MPKEEFSISDLKQLYEIEKLPQKKIAEMCNVSQSLIGTRIRKCGIQLRERSEANLLGNKRTYNVNKDFFKRWTQESAWVYGWIIGDGCYTNPRMLRFIISPIDIEVLYKFKKLMISEHPVVNYKSWSIKYQKYYDKSVLCICSKEIVSSLKKLSYLDIPSEFLSHFIRGFWEAEGSVHKDKNSNCIYIDFAQNDKSILTYIFNSLKLNRIVNSGGLRSNNKNNNAWKLTFSTKDAVSIYHYIYDNCDSMFLTRKKKKSEEMLKMQNKGD